MKKLLVVLAVLLLGAGASHAQKTKAQITTEIGTLYPDNNVGAITPQALRTVSLDTINSIMPTAPVVTGNLACFSGTTGLLQDCGYSPINAPLVIGTAPITGGTTTRILYDNAGVLGEYTISGSGAVCMNVSCSMTTPALGVATASSIALNGCTIGANIFCVTGASSLGDTTVNTLNGLTITPSVGTLTIPNNASASLVLSGNFLTTLTATGATNSTLPSGTHSLVGKDTTDVLTNKTFNSTATGNVLQVSGVTVSAGQYPGEPTNGGATAGNVGEYVVSDIPSGSAVGLTSTTNANLTSISLTAGDWDVTFVPTFTGGATTTLTFAVASISTTTASPDATLGRSNNQFYNNATVFNNLNPSQPIPVRRFSLSGTTTIFGVVRANFATSTCSAFGTLSARRVR